jgi:hypothetical protein
MRHGQCDIGYIGPDKQPMLNWQRLIRYRKRPVELELRRIEWRHDGKLFGEFDVCGGADANV